METPNKQDIFQKVKELAEEALREDEFPSDGGSCAYWMIAGHVVLARHGINSVFQAGSAQWPMINMEEDDGKRCTHFAYMWDPEHPLSQFATSIGAMPEFHSWLGIMETQELVDFSTHRLMQ